MKTKNVKVRTKDIKSGKVIFISHPVYGIEKLLITSKPYMLSGIGLFARAVVLGEYGGYERSFSLNDAGITRGESYNGRRSFYKLKQAENWVMKWGNDHDFKTQHQDHCDMIADWFDDDWHYIEEYEDDDYFQYRESDQA